MSADHTGKPVETQDKLSRRDAIEKMGRFAAYTAPAMMVLLTTEKAMARSNEGDRGTSGGQDRNGPKRDSGKKGGH